MQPAAAGWPPVPGAPRLTAAACELLRAIEVLDEHGARRLIHVPAERPLTVFVDERELVTLMTLGASPELLVLGHLFNQRLISAAAQVAAIAVDWGEGRACVQMRTPLPALEARLARGAATAGCGQDSTAGSLLRQAESVRLPAAGAARIRQSTLQRLLEAVRRPAGIHRSAGSVHNCALFRGADLLVSVEDVGRHNALDTIAGWMLMHGVVGEDKVLFTTARLTAEMIAKMARCAIPIGVSRNGISAMAYELATRLGMTLFGRAANRHFLCYTGFERFDAEPEAHSSTGAHAD